MSASRVVHSLHTVAEPANHVHQQLQVIKARLVSELNAGRRNYDELRLMLERYISYQIALDTLNGYCELERIKP